jgi:hypothetical protein
MLYPYLAPADDTSGDSAATPGEDDDDGDAEPQRPDDISEAEWNALSPNERAAIAEPEDDTEALARIAQPEEGDDDDADDDKKGAKDTKAADDKADKADDKDKGAKDGDDDKAAGKDKPADAKADKTGADGAEAGTDADGPGEFQLALRADADPEKIAKDIEAVESKRDALTAKFKAGELEVDEYTEQDRALAKEVRVLEKAQTKAEFALEHNQQTSTQRWEWECETFFAKAESKIYENRLLAAAHDAAVRDMVSEENLKAHPERMKWSGAKILAEADKEVRASFKLETKAAAADVATDPKAKAEAEAKAAAEKKAADKKAALDGRRPDPKKIPKTLADVPAAAGADADGEDEFAALDKLSGMELENALAKLSPAKAEKYLQSA